MVLPWFERLVKRPASRSRHAGRRLLSLAPCLEILEDRTLPTIGLTNNFAGLDYNAGRTEPPDTGVAAGPNLLVETVNLTIAYLSKSTGAQVFQENLQQFFAPVNPGAL